MTRSSVHAANASPLTAEIDLMLAAGSLVNDPNDDSGRVAHLLSQMRGKFRRSQVTKRDMDVLTHLYDLRAPSLLAVVEKAQSPRSFYFPEFEAADLFKGMLRMILVRQMTRGEQLTHEQEEAYQRVRIIR